MINIGELVHDFYSNTLKLPDNISSILVYVTSVVFIVLMALVTIRIVKLIIFKGFKVESNGARALTVARLSSSITRYVVWFVAILLILGVFSVDITPFIASAGVIGIAFGFGAQKLVQDFISGFFIIFEGSFVVGDVVEIDGFKGSVLSLGLKTTVIENWKGERKIISNGNIGSIINFSENDSLAIIEFGVGYETDLMKFKKIIVPFLEVTKKKYSEIVELPKYLGVTKLDDSSINMMIICKTGSMQHFQVERDVRADLVIYLNKNEIEIPFPQVVVHNA
jgi:small conductance mechanosensitive channel